MHSAYVKTVGDQNMGLIGFDGEQEELSACKSARLFNEQRLIANDNAIRAAA